MFWEYKRRREKLGRVWARSELRSATCTCVRQCPTRVRRYVLGLGPNHPSASKFFSMAIHDCTNPYCHPRMIIHRANRIQNRQARLSRPFKSRSDGLSRPFKSMTAYTFNKLRPVPSIQVHDSLFCPFKSTSGGLSHPFKSMTAYSVH